jgi:hypothetical protein
MPFRTVLLLSALIGPRFVGRNSKIRNRLTTRRESNFWIRAKISNQDDLIHRTCHDFVPFSRTEPLRIGYQNHSLEMSERLPYISVD